MIRRSLWAALALLSLAVAGRAGEDSLARYDHVVVDPAKSSIFVGSVTMSFTPATRDHASYESVYTAKVFPYFFMSETGRLHLDAPDEALQRLARGEKVELNGYGVSADGQKRRFEGQAIPTNATSGRLKVRAFVSKRISLAFDMAYRFTPTAK